MVDGTTVSHFAVWEGGVHDPQRRSNEMGCIGVTAEIVAQYIKDYEREEFYEGLRKYYLEVADGAYVGGYTQVPESTALQFSTVEHAAEYSQHTCRFMDSSAKIVKKRVLRWGFN